MIRVDLKVPLSLTSAATKKLNLPVRWTAHLKDLLEDASVLTLRITSPLVDEHLKYSTDLFP